MDRLPLTLNTTPDCRMVELLKPTIVIDANILMSALITQH